jgi:hypothetical protein
LEGNNPHKSDVEKLEDFKAAQKKCSVERGGGYQLGGTISNSVKYFIFLLLILWMKKSTTQECGEVTAGQAKCFMAKQKKGEHAKGMNLVV